MQLQELSKTTDEKLTSLNALAEHVTQKAKALEGQKHTIDRAVVEANRLNEMVWSMDVQIGKLNEGLKQAARGEETIAPHREAGRGDQRARSRPPARRATSSRAKRRASRRTAARSSTSCARTSRSSALEKKEFEAFDQRLRALQTAVGEAEGRMDALAAQGEAPVAAHQRVDALSKEFQALLGQADELTKKQANLETLQRASRRRSTSCRSAPRRSTTALKQSRADLETLRKDIQDFHKSHAEVAQLRDKLGADRAALEAFGDRLTSFRARTPELEATMDAILGQAVAGRRTARRRRPGSASSPASSTRS